jgi:hypothetical protein
MVHERKLLETQGLRSGINRPRMFTNRSTANRFLANRFIADGFTLYL